MAARARRPDEPHPMARRVGRALMLATVCVLHLAAWHSIVHGIAVSPVGSSARPDGRAIHVSFVRILEPAPPPAPRRKRPPAVPSTVIPPALEAPEIDVAVPSRSVPGSGSVSKEQSTSNEAIVQPAPWPPSTRLVYAAMWQDRGSEAHGTLVLEWRREGDHYEIDLVAQPDLGVPFHLASEGAITADALLPQRFVRGATPAGLSRDEATYEGDRMRLTDGRTLARPPDAQDPASELMDAAHAFALHPEWLESGRTIDRPIAAPGHVGRWLVDPQPAQSVDVGWGRIECIRLAAHAPSADWGMERPPEACMAPTLDGLPVRLEWSFGSGATLTLSLASLPMQAGPAAAQGADAR